MRTHYTAALTALGLLAAGGAAADIEARFVESAPKDRFELVNAGACDTGPIVLSVDLSRSAAGLIFDTTGAGAGVEVFQPFDLVAGGDLLRDVPVVLDGMTQVDLKFDRFPAGAKLTFTVDVDDTLTSSDLGQIRVSGGEIEGAVLRAEGAEGSFGTDGRAVLKRAICTS